MKKFAATTALIVALAGSFTIFGQGNTEKLASGTYIVYPTSPQAWRFKVDANMANAAVTGTYSTTAGTPATVDVFIFDQDSFFKWRGDDEAARAAAKPIFTAGRKGAGEINFKVPAPGVYFLVFSNMFAYEGTKTIKAETKLQFDKK